jgi:hypothetical protein
LNFISLRVAPGEDQAGGLRQAKYKVHILYGLSGCAFYKVIYGGKDDGLRTVRMDGEVAKISVLNPVDIRGTGHNADKKIIFIKISIDRL